MKLHQLERLLLGRFFTRAGAQLRELAIVGLGAHMVLFAMLFHVQTLERLELDAGGGDVGGALPALHALVHMVNRECLKDVSVPLGEWLQGVGGAEFVKVCVGTWDTLFRSYRAGVKEGAVNMEEDVETKYLREQARLDKLEIDMSHVLERLMARAEEGDMAVDVLQSCGIKVT